MQGEDSEEFAATQKRSSCSRLESRDPKRPRSGPTPVSSSDEGEEPGASCPVEKTKWRCWWSCTGVRPGCCTSSSAPQVPRGGLWGYFACVMHHYAVLILLQVGLMVAPQGLSVPGNNALLTMLWRRYGTELTEFLAETRHQAEIDDWFQSRFMDIMDLVVHRFISNQMDRRNVSFVSQRLVPIAIPASHSARSPRSPLPSRARPARTGPRSLATGIVCGTLLALHPVSSHRRQRSVDLVTAASVRHDRRTAGGDGYHDPCPGHVTGDVESLTIDIPNQPDLLDASARPNVSTQHALPSARITRQATAAAAATTNELTEAGTPAAGRTRPPPGRGAPRPQVTSLPVAQVALPPAAVRPFGGAMTGPASSTQLPHESLMLSILRSSEALRTLVLGRAGHRPSTINAVIGAAQEHLIVRTEEDDAAVTEEREAAIRQFQRQPDRK